MRGVSQSVGEGTSVLYQRGFRDKQKEVYMQLACFNCGTRLGEHVEMTSTE